MDNQILKQNGGLMSDQIRVRLAPSPTGKFHIGTARTALFNYLFAKKYGGVFVLRIEDTDTERSTKEFEQDITDGLHWLGLDWSEGPGVGGDFAPYTQMERLESYKKYANSLLEKGLAYKCFCTREELEEERSSQQKAGAAPKYSGKCRGLTNEEVAAKEASKLPFVVRFKVNPGEVAFDDLIKGHVSFDMSLVGDFPIIRSDGMPLFLLAALVDDIEMRISHVLRGEDHLANTAKQILLAEALEELPPQFGHLPMILNADRSKMSKRKNPVSVTDDYQAKGYLPETLLNFMALLGWNSGTEQEIYTLDELVEAFSLDHVGKSPSIFDEEKLLWMNGYYLRQLPLGDLATRALPFITDLELSQEVKNKPDLYLAALALVQERIKLLSEVSQLVKFFFVRPSYDSSILVAKKSDKERTLLALKASYEALDKLELLTTENTEEALRNTAAQNNLTAGELLWSVRVALSGAAASPGAFELLDVLGKTESLERIKSAIQALQN